MNISYIIRCRCFDFWDPYAHTIYVAKQPVKKKNKKNICIIIRLLHTNKTRRRVSFITNVKFM